MSRLVFVPAAALALTLGTDALAGGHPDGAALVRLLAKNAPFALSHTGSASAVSGLVRLPSGVSAESVGLLPVVPGFGRVRGTSAILAFSSAHPELRRRSVAPRSTC